MFIVQRTTAELTRASMLAPSAMHASAKGRKPMGGLRSLENDSRAGQSRALASARTCVFKLK